MFGTTGPDVQAEIAVDRTQTRAKISFFEGNHLAVEVDALGRFRERQIFREAVDETFTPSTLVPDVPAGVTVRFVANGVQRPMLQFRPTPELVTAHRDREELRRRANEARTARAEEKAREERRKSAQAAAGRQRVRQSAGSVIDALVTLEVFATAAEARRAALLGGIVAEVILTADGDGQGQGQTTDIRTLEPDDTLPLGLVDVKIGKSRRMRLLVVE
jgi:hypothetical protein